VTLLTRTHLPRFFRVEFYFAQENPRRAANEVARMKILRSKYRRIWSRRVRDLFDGQVLRAWPDSSLILPIEEIPISRESVARDRGTELKRNLKIIVN
jgi:hypothetical protein